MTTGAGNIFIDTIFLCNFFLIQLVEQEQGRLLHGSKQKEDGKYYCRNESHSMQR